jgi:hypothetical protein
VALLLCGLIPGGSFYTFAVDHNPPGEIHSDGALVKWEYAEYGYGGEHPDPNAAARYVCSTVDHEAIMRGMGDFTPDRVRRNLEMQGLKDSNIRFSWAFPSNISHWTEPTRDETTIPQVLEITTSWWRTPGPEEGRTEPYLTDVQSSHRVDFGMRRNSYGRWCVHSAKYLGPVEN